jgi:transcriptional regulator with XRE-family HTH domain
MDWVSLVGRNIRRFRRERDLTQEQLAHLAGIDMRYLGGVERGEHNPTVDVLGRLAGAMDVHPRDFFEGEGSGA